jgi:hypothetical protein
MAHTAPPGYESNHHAIMDLVRFGPAIWTLAQWAALLFHAERSTAYGKDSDQHSESQAMDGIYSVRRFEWVRGPAGLGRSTWYKTNAQLEIDPEHPEQTPNGVLKRHRTGTGRGQVVEYELDWGALKRRIQKWKQEGSTGRTLSGPEAAQEGSTGRTLSGPEAAQEGSTGRTLKGPQDGPFLKNCGAENKGTSEKEGSTPWTHSQSLTLKSDITVSQDVCSRAEIADAIEAACGERPMTDRLINQILIPNRKLRLPAEVIARWVQDFTFDRRAAKYTVRAGLYGTAFEKHIMSWLKQNQHFVAECQRKAELKRKRVVADVGEMKSPVAQPNPPDEQQMRALDERLRASRAEDAVERKSQGKGA